MLRPYSTMVAGIRLRRILSVGFSNVVRVVGSGSSLSSIGPPGGKCPTTTTSDSRYTATARLQ